MLICVHKPQAHYWTQTLLCKDFHLETVCAKELLRSLIMNFNEEVAAGLEAFSRLQVVSVVIGVNQCFPEE